MAAEVREEEIKKVNQTSTTQPKAPESIDEGLSSIVSLE